MKTNPLKEGALTGNSAGIGVVTREMGQMTLHHHHGHRGLPMFSTRNSPIL
jgi:hypothetical protein